METEFVKSEFERAVAKVLWAVGQLPSREERVMALKAAVERLRTLGAKPDAA
jgi:hypothetical protein